MTATDKRMVCAQCGSTRIKVDAQAVWNEELQQWEIDSVDPDVAVCEPCGAGTHAVERNLR